jgi:glycoside/pentoside/hexuronide:cation symporter, GPH family
MAYAAPVLGSWFYYIPMWSILPAVYGKYFGLPLTAIAGALVVIRIFDGIIDTTIGYLADRHRAAGGSRKPWVVVGGLGTVITCYFLFVPPQPATLVYYLTWSFAFFLMFTISEIPHLTWGSELTPDYNRRATVYGVRNIGMKTGMAFFYALPLLPLYASNDYTPEVLRDAVWIGGALTLFGLSWTLWRAPAGVPGHFMREDSIRLLVQSLTRNRPLQMYLAAWGLIGLYVGMYYALLYLYLDGYLGLGTKVAVMLLTATVIATVTTPLWVELIHRTSKSTSWTIAVGLFGLQLVGALFVEPGVHWLWVFILVVLANLSFSGHDVSALSILGDVVDYGKWKFNKDRGTTYFGFCILTFKIALGIGGGMALGLAGWLGFDPTQLTHDDTSILGLKLGFIVLPSVFLVIGMVVIARFSIDPRRHGILRRRLEARLSRGEA